MGALFSLEILLARAVKGLSVSSQWVSQVLSQAGSETHWGSVISPDELVGEIVAA